MGIDRGLALAADVTVVVVDDHAGFRAALKMALEANGVRVVGSADGGEAAIAMVGELEPDVVVMDLAMPGMNGVQATRAIVARPRPPAVIALSGSRELMREAVAAGARLTVLKDADPLQLISAVRSVAGSDNSESRPMGVTSEAKLASNDE